MKKIFKILKDFFTRNKELTAEEEQEIVKKIYDKIRESQ